VSGLRFELSTALLFVENTAVNQPPRQQEKEIIIKKVGKQERRREVRNKRKTNIGKGETGKILFWTVHSAEGI
jgi:hypothetical protein